MTIEQKETLYLILLDHLNSLKEINFMTWDVDCHNGCKLTMSKKEKELKITVIYFYNTGETNFFHQGIKTTYKDIEIEKNNLLSSKQEASLSEIFLFLIEKSKDFSYDPFFTSLTLYRDKGILMTCSVMNTGEINLDNKTYSLKNFLKLLKEIWRN